MELTTYIAWVGLAALIAYAVLGGADFGAGVWDLLARGPRAREQREAIAHAMGPVWEANHVWLIFLIVLLFSCFPPAFSALSVALYVPFHLALVGIILRGAAFVFRSYGAGSGRAGQIWSRVFGAASSLTPALLGMCLGAITSGRIVLREGQVLSDPWTPWLGPLSWCLGAFSLAICAALTAVYLTLETAGEVREDFRRKALQSGAVLTALAVLTLLAARQEAPVFFSQLTGPSSAPIFAAAALAEFGSWYTLKQKQFAAARALMVVLVSLLVLGWARAQQPYLIYPGLTLAGAASPEPTLRFVLLSLIPGGALLIPSLALLFIVFKGNPAHPNLRT